MVQERRHFERVGLDSHLLVLLDEAKYGLLSDLSADGLAADVLAARNLGETIPFSFYLPEKSNCIQGKAEIVWTNDLEHRIGLHFLELADPSREQLVEWISARAEKNRLAAAEKQVIPPSPATQETLASEHPKVEDSPEDIEPPSVSSMFPSLFSEELESGNPEQRIAGELQDNAKSRRTMAIALASVLLFSVIGYLVYHWRETRMDPQVRESMAAEKVPELPAPDAAAPVNPPSEPASALPRQEAAAPAVPAKPSPAAAPFSPPVARLDHPGYVLQVGAMKNEANADAMARDLQKENFPAFVFRRGSDRLYKVAIGPFKDKDSSIRATKQLEQRGLKTLLKRWTPE